MAIIGKKAVVDYFNQNCISKVSLHANLVIYSPNFIDNLS
jgi:hypothetical protein